MAFDFKKEYKEFYMPKNRPEIVTVPKANYIAVRGKGNPNEAGGAYQQAIGVLYAVAYTLKMSYKTDHRIDGFFEYVSTTNLSVGLPPMSCLKKNSRETFTKRMLALQDSFSALLLRNT